MSIKVKILWIDGDIGCGRNEEYGDFALMEDDIKGHKEGDIITIGEDYEYQKESDR